MAFYLLAPTVRGGPLTRVGEGSLSLQAILSGRKDVLESAVQLHWRSEYVGSFTVSVHALSVLLRAHADGLRRRESTGTDVAGIAAKTMRPAGDAAAASDEVNWMLVAADPRLAREGPGLVERFLIRPPDAEQADAESTGLDDVDEQSTKLANSSAATSSVDGARYAEELSLRFRRYLQHKAVCIDVWDGASLLQIGTARVPLAALLKKGTERVGAAFVTKEHLVVDVLDTGLMHINSAQRPGSGAAAAPPLRGKLKLLMSRVSSALPATTAVVMGTPLTGARYSGAVSSSPRELGRGACQKVRARALSDAAAGSHVPSSFMAREVTAAEEAAHYRKQLRRQKHRAWLRFDGGVASAAFPTIPAVPHSSESLLATGTGNTVSLARSLELGIEEEQSLARAKLQLQQRSLRSAAAYRESHRDERLRFLLTGQTTVMRYIYPSYGTAELVELPFRNPYSEPHTFTVDWDDAHGHVSLVSCADEWRSFRRLRGLSAPVEETLLLRGRQLWLQAHELVYIPLKYQGWHGQVGLSLSDAAEGVYQPGDIGGVTRIADAAARPLARSSVRVRVLNVTSEAVGALELRVRPQPYIIDQTFRFHQSENDLLKTTIRVSFMRRHAPPVLPHSHAAAGAIGLAPISSFGANAPTESSAAVWVHASDPRVQCGMHTSRGSADPLEVFIKFKCGSSPVVTRFLVLVYADEWLHQLLETWELVVHALQRVDVHALVGQTSLAKAVLRGRAVGGVVGAAGGLVQCFSSAPYELRLSPNGPFPLAGVTEVVLALRPLHPGRSQYVVHAVDLARRALLASWLVCAVNRLPAITKAFSLSVPAALGSRKKVNLTNPYTYDVSYHFFTDQPCLLKFSQPSVTLPAGQSQYIGLQFVPLPGGKPSAPESKSRFMIFINNEEDKNEECMEVSVMYV